MSAYTVSEHAARVREYIERLQGEPDWLVSFRQKALKKLESAEWPDYDKEETWRKSPLDIDYLSSLQHTAPVIPSMAIPRTDSGSAAPDGLMAEMAGIPVPMQQLSAYVAYLDSEPIIVATEGEESGVKIFTLDDVRRNTLPADIEKLLFEKLEQGLAKANSAFDYWHYASIDALQLIVSEGDSNKICLIDHFCGAAELRFPHTLIFQKGMGRLSVVERFRSAEEDNPSFVSHALCGKAQTRLDYHILQNLNLSSRMIRTSQLEAVRNSQMSHFEAHVGAGWVKGLVHADIPANGVDALLNGMYFAKGEQHYDIATVQSHTAGNSGSRSLYKGAVDESAYSVFRGLIDIAPKSEKTDAYLTNNNLVLQDGARADSIPTLEIHTDDVKCSHGSTTGRLLPDHVFYLQSRGFSQEEARTLLVEGFLLEPASITPDFLQQELQQLVAQKI